MLALVEECSLSSAQARKRMAHVAGALAGWKEAALKNNVREHEITMMAESVQPRL